MTNQEILARVDHTLLKADAKKEDVSTCGRHPLFFFYSLFIIGQELREFQQEQQHRNQERSRD